MKAEDLRATLISLKTYVEEAEEKCRVVRLELAATILELEEEVPTRILATKLGLFGRRE